MGEKIERRSEDVSGRLGYTGKQATADTLNGYKTVVENDL